MAKRIKVADLPDFDAAPYLDSKESVAAYDNPKTAQSADAA
jgi:hypothetical protein